jgi:hypothetical protein
MDFSAVCQVSGGHKSPPAVEYPVVLDRVLIFPYAPRTFIIMSKRGKS